MDMACSVAAVMAAQAGVRADICMMPVPALIRSVRASTQAIGVTAKPQPLDAAAWVAQYFGSALTASYSLNQSYKTPDSALLWYRAGGSVSDRQWRDVVQVLRQSRAVLDPAYLDEWAGRLELVGLLARARAEAAER